MWHNILSWKFVSSVQITATAHHKHFFKNSRLYPLSFAPGYLWKLLVRQDDLFWCYMMLHTSFTKNIHCLPQVNVAESQGSSWVVTRTPSLCSPSKGQISTGRVGVLHTARSTACRRPFTLFDCLCTWVFMTVCCCCCCCECVRACTRVCMCARVRMKCVCCVWTHARMCRCVSVRGHAARFLSFVNVLLMRACVHVMFVVITFLFVF